MSDSRKYNPVILFVNQIREARRARISKEPSGDRDYVKIVLQFESGKIGRKFDKATLFQVNMYIT